MQWMQQLNEAITYIEENLDEEISFQKVARIAGCSTYHFQRMFTYIAGIPLSEYIRRRRLTKAAFALQAGEKVLDVALHAGYDSPTSFNRAFQVMHGIAPSLAKKEGTSLKAYGKITFSMTIKGETEMEYRIEKKEAFRVVGYSLTLEKDNDESFVKIPLYWNEMNKNGKVGHLCSMMDNQIPGLLGICCSGDNETSWKYYIAIVHKGGTPEGMESYMVPASTWAIFPGQGEMPQVIQGLEKQILSEWLPTSGFEFGTAPDIEVYLSEDPKDQRFEVWVPLLTKN